MYIHIPPCLVYVDLKPETVSSVRGETIRRVDVRGTRAPIRDATLNTTTIFILDLAYDVVCMPVRMV